MAPETPDEEIKETREAGVFFTIISVLGLAGGGALGFWGGSPYFGASVAIVAAIVGLLGLTMWRPESRRLTLSDVRETMPLGALGTTVMWLTFVVLTVLSALVFLHESPILGLVGTAWWGFLTVISIKDVATLWHDAIRGAIRGHEPEVYEQPPPALEPADPASEPTIIPVSSPTKNPDDLR